MASKGKLLSIIAGLLIISSSVAGVSVGVLHNKRKLDTKILNLNNDIPENIRSLKILYTENQEQILSLINEQRKVLRTEKSHIDIQLKDVEFKFNPSVPSVTISAKKSSKVLKGSVEIKFNKPNIDSLIKEESRNLGVFEVRSIEKVIERLVERNVLNNKDFNAEKIKQNFDIEIKEQEKTIKVKAKSDSIFYVGEIEFSYNLPQFSTLQPIETNISSLLDNQQDTILDKFFEINKEILEKDTVKITRDQLKVELVENGAKITVENNINYEGSINITYSVKDQFNTIQRIVKDITYLKNNDTQSVLNRFIELNSNLLNSHKITRDQLQVVVNDNVATITVNGNNIYQGSIQVNLSLSKQTHNYLNVLLEDDHNSILKAINSLNKWNFSLNDLNIQVQGNTATITGKTEKNKKFIGTITAQFGLKATYTEDKKELTRIGFFKNSDNEWQIEKIDTNTNKVVSLLPTFITNLEDAFERNENATISGLESWDTSNVTTMKGMFRDAQAFNQPLGDKFDTSNVKNMSFMFYFAKAFNQALGDKFDTSKVENMEHMFDWAHAFNQPLGDKFDTSNVTTMKGMFWGAKAFNQDISHFNTSQVTDMRSMFDDASSFNQNINTQQKQKLDGTTYTAWDVSRVTDMRKMFRNAKAFNQDISKWNVTINDTEKFINFNNGANVEFKDQKLPEKIRNSLRTNS